MRPETNPAPTRGENRTPPLHAAIPSMSRGSLIRCFAFSSDGGRRGLLAYNQTPAAHAPKTDAEKIADALSAGPKFVTRHATILDWPSSLGGEFRVLRAGNNGWTCLPGFPLEAHDEPGCYDKVFLQFFKDSFAGRTPNLQNIGISYMYGGKWVPNVSHPTGPRNEFHVGPHIMIIGLDQKMLRTFNQDGSNGQPYANHIPGHTELYLVIPIREWSDADVPGVRAIGAATP
jgi:hypothetical protein